MHPGLRLFGRTDATGACKLGMKQKRLKQACPSGCISLPGRSQGPRNAVVFLSDCRRVTKYKYLICLDFYEEKAVAAGGPKGAGQNGSAAGSHDNSKLPKAVAELSGPARVARARRTAAGAVPARLRVAYGEAG
jgi:hypothetical protein